MKVSRAKRYKDKMNIILKRSDQADDWLQELFSAQTLEDDKTKLATYKAFQEIVEATMDIVAMMLKDMEKIPKDDYSNIESLEINEETKAVLREANGLRNRLVHRYNQTDDLAALESMRIILPDMRSFIEEVELWIRKRLEEE